MKKVININFQGAIIPIEENAYENLKQYSESLRRHFAMEEGRDEIINDIETRISELFSETLKKGATCITDDDVNAVIASMGRPEDFEREGEIGYESTPQQEKSFDSNYMAGNAAQANSNTTKESQTSTTDTTTKRLFRDENHKILGGVCSGVANYFNIDPVVIRILAIIFFSVALIPYIVIWIVVPSTATQVIGSTRKRLFRDTDNKRIAGVCSGIAQYFGVSTKLVRILFLLPFISIAFRMHNWFGWSFPHFLSLSFSPAATISYIILWILVPEAKSSSDKLEMQGKPVDLNSIKDTVQNDLNEFKNKAQKWSKDISGTAQKWSNDISTAAQNMGKKNETQESETPNENVNNSFTESAYQDSSNYNTKKENRSGVPLIIKIIGYILLGLIVTPILLSLFGVGIGFMAVLPATDFVLKNGWETILAWGTFLFFIWVPIIGIILWFFRLITKSSKGTTAIRTTFIGLWVIGWICFFGLFSFMGKDFSHSAYSTPTTFDYKDKNIQTMIVTAQSKDEYNSWNDQQDFNDFLRYFGNDSIRIPNTSLKIEASKDDNYHVESVTYANGATKEEAAALASKIQYSFSQKDSLLFIPTDFFINRNDKFRNQRILIKIFVPIGKRIFISEKGNVKSNINIGTFGVHRNTWDNSENYWDTETLYVMTAEGLKPVEDAEKKSDENGNNSQPNNNNKPTQHKTNTDNTDEDNSNNNEETIIRKKPTNNVSNKKFSFVSVASLLSNKFFL